MDSSDIDSPVITGARCSAIFRDAHKRLDPIPRPLGAKRSALQARKHRHATLLWHVGLVRTTGADGACLLTSTDGTTAFAISRTTTALVVEKRHCPLEGPQTSHVMLFENGAAFDRWCDIEPTRFDDPLLCDQLRRRGHEFFVAHE